MKLTSALFLLLFNGLSTLADRGINKKEILLIGGIRQVINLKGRDSSLPLLLFLHGGPGGSVMAGADRFTSKLQEHFVVVQWDQRQTGQTLLLNNSPVPLSVAIFEQDTHELVDSLLHRFQRQKLFLVGHSWGTVLGFYLADKYPESLYAYIAISPVVDQHHSEEFTLQMLKNKALQDHNEQEQQELAGVHIPFENGEQLFWARKWLLIFNGQNLGNAKNIHRYVLDWSRTWLGVWSESVEINLFETLPQLHCPVYFFVGRKDFQTYYQISADYFNQLQAPKKELFWFENSGHLIPDTEPERMQQIILEKILPENSRL